MITMPVFSLLQYMYMYVACIQNKKYKHLVLRNKLIAPQESNAQWLLFEGQHFGISRRIKS